MVLSGPSVFVLLWFNLCTHDCGGFCPQKLNKVRTQQLSFLKKKKKSNLQVEKLLDMLPLKRLRLPKLRFPIIHEPQTEWECSEGSCVLCVSRGAMTRRLTLTRWVWRLATHCYSSTRVALARVHVEVLRGCLRAQSTRLVVSVVCLKIVIHLWLCYMRRSDPSVSHKRLHKHRPGPDTHTLLYSCLCEAFTLTSIHFPFFCAAKPLTTVYLTQTSTLLQFILCL